MKTSYPTNERTTFLLCEDIRQEEGNKVSLLGVIGSTLNISKKDTTGGAIPALHGLGFYFLFTDGEGEFEQRFELLGPDNETIVSAQPKKATKDETQHMSMSITVKPFVIKNFGSYLARAYLNERMYERSFSLVEV